MKLKNTQKFKLALLMSLLLAFTMAITPNYSRAEGIKLCKNGFLKALDNVQQHANIERKAFYIEFYKVSMECYSNYLGSQPSKSTIMKVIGFVHKQFITKMTNAIELEDLEKSKKALLEEEFVAKTEHLRLEKIHLEELEQKKRALNTKLFSILALHGLESEQVKKATENFQAALIEVKEHENTLLYLEEQVDIIKAKFLSNERLIQIPKFELESEIKAVNQIVLLIEDSKEENNKDNEKLSIQ